MVSRAHRMGATRSVLVETLAMRGTIEEQMLEFLKVAYLASWFQDYLMSVAETSVRIVKRLAA